MFQIQIYHTSEKTLKLRKVSGKTRYEISWNKTISEEKEQPILLKILEIKRRPQLKIYNNQTYIRIKTSKIGAVGGASKERSEL